MKSCNIIFKKMDKDDLKQLYQWFQMPHVLKCYARDKQYSFEEIQEKYLPRVNDSSIPSFIIYDQNKPVGYIQFYYLTDHIPEGMDNRHSLFNDFNPNELIGIDLFIADENYLRVGFSSEALTLFINTYLKQKFKAVLVDPLKENLAAISFFEKNGFKHVISHNDNYVLMIKDNFQ